MKILWCTNTACSAAEKLELDNIEFKVGEAYSSTDIIVRNKEELKWETVAKTAKWKYVINTFRTYAE